MTRAGVNANSSNLTLVTENAADATVLGLEGDIKWLIGDSMILTAGFNAIDSEFKDYDA